MLGKAAKENSEWDTFLLQLIAQKYFVLQGLLFFKASTLIKHFTFLCHIISSHQVQTYSTELLNNHILKKLVILNII